MVRGHWFVIISLFLFQPPAIAGKACDTNTSKILNSLFGPRDVQWKVDLRHHCTILDQGTMGTCWATSGIEFYNQFFHRYGMMEPEQRLSADYYVSKYIRNQMEKGYQQHYISKKEGFNLEGIHDFVFDQGFVFEDDFHFPKINGKSIVEDDELLQEMYQELHTQHEFGASPKEFSKLLDHYLGDLKTVTPQKLTPEQIESVRPMVVTSEKFEKVQLPKIEKEITASLDRQVPVQFAMKDYGNRLFEADKTGHIKTGRQAPSDLGGGHGMNIVGYRLDKKGKVDLYLLQNSFGTNYGHDGFITIDAKYFYEKLRSYRLAPYPAE